MRSMTEGQETYLGDGLYASFDGWQVILRAPREGGDHWVGIEPLTLMALVDFILGAQATAIRQAFLDAAEKRDLDLERE